MSRRTTQAGFTLIEVIVYIAILVLVSAAAVTALVSFSDVLDNQRVQQRVTSSAQGALERMVHDIRNSTAVNVGGSTLADPDGVLQLTHSGGDITFARSGGVITVTRGSEPAVPLTSSDVSVDALAFYHYADGPTELVRVSLTVSATSSTQTRTETFYGGAVIRGSYD